MLIELPIIQIGLFVMDYVQPLLNLLTKFCFMIRTGPEMVSEYVLKNLVLFYVLKFKNETSPLCLSVQELIMTWV